MHITLGIPAGFFQIDREISKNNQKLAPAVPIFD